MEQFFKLKMNVITRKRYNSGYFLSKGYEVEIRYEIIHKERKRKKKGSLFHEKKIINERSLEHALRKKSSLFRLLK
jgi:F420-0:gamma-glutamyl ligase-like protein